MDAEDEVVDTLKRDLGTDIKTAGILHEQPGLACQACCSAQTAMID